MVKISNSLREYVSSSRDSDFLRLGIEKIYCGKAWYLLAASERFVDSSLTSTKASICCP